MKHATRARPMPFNRAASELALAHQYVQRLPEFFPEERYLLLPYQERRQVERRRRVERVGGFLEKGAHTLTLDLGCMGGQTTLPLQQTTGGKVVGVERNPESIRLAQARSAANPALEYLAGDFLGWDLPRGMPGRADQILAAYFLHEIFSTYGWSGYCAALSKCRALLREGGRLIVLDGVRPDDARAEVRFKDKETREQFDRFIDLYKVFRLEYAPVDDMTIQVNLGDFARFLNGFKFTVPADLKGYAATLEWIDREEEKIARAFYILGYYAQHPRRFAPEYEQDFTFNSSGQWLASMHAAGFDVECVKTFNERRIETSFWKSGVELLAPGRELPEIHILVVGRKR
jgi:SAM-dependent methyltransferase